MQVCLNDLLEKNGLSVSSGMSATSMLSLFSKVPVFLDLFPSIAGMVNSLNTLLNLYNKAKDFLITMEENLISAEKALTKAQQLQTFVASQSKPISSSPGSPCAPDVATGVLVQTALQAAQKAVDAAKQNVEKAKEDLQKAEDKVNNQINNIVKKVFSERILWQS